MKQKKWKKWDEMKQEFSNESVHLYTVTAFCLNDLIKRFRHYSFFCLIQIDEHFLLCEVLWTLVWNGNQTVCKLTMANKVTMFKVFIEAVFLTMG